MKNIHWLVILAVILVSDGAQAQEAPSTGEAYNQGVAFYNEGDYNKARESFLKALNTESNRLEQWTNYNLGNSNFKKAQGLKQKDQAAALSLYQNALEFFHRAIETDTKDNDAKYNYELTARKIKELETQQKENPNKQPDSEQKDKQSQGKKERQQQNQSQQKDARDESEQKKQLHSGQKTAPEEDAEVKQMTKKEAEMLLNNFERSEKEQKQLFLRQKQHKHSPVDKDW